MDRYKELVYRFENRLIGEEEFADELAQLPGYPAELRGQRPRPGDDLRIRVRSSRLTTFGPPKVVRSLLS